MNNSLNKYMNLCFYFLDFQFNKYIVHYLLQFNILNIKYFHIL